MNFPSIEEFRAMARDGQLVPVYSDLLADMLTPLSAYWRVAHDAEYSFLLESVTGGEQLARYSLLGVHPSVVLRSKNRRVTRISGGKTTTTELEPGEDPLHVLERDMPPKPYFREGLPKFVGGAVGMFSYDIVRFFEKLPDSTNDDLSLDDMAMMICRHVIVFDHAKNLIRLLVLADPTDEGYHQARATIDATIARLRQPIPGLPGGTGPTGDPTSNVSQSEYEGMVSRMKEYIAAGDGIQMVPSQRFTVETQSHPLSIYRSLRSLNPSPYMFLLRFGDFDLVGASPELLVGLAGDEARVRPIAGTRWRGKSEAEDVALESELLADEKERAEHIMLVDLGRNDLGRVCEYGTVRVNQLMVIERYSHVMHIVSDVVGKLRKDLSGFDLFRATFPAGTVSGAPKIRAMQIIDELEPTRRGAYAGSVGYFSATGDLDTSITLRSILLKDGKAYVQAGAGIVFDSDPTKEFEETCNKARAPLQAIKLAAELNEA
ncbi:MAG: anthranilate synthase component I [Armatimonadetes bacterium]|nr:anthranilate synthase component I [Armatimonadota bacterium]